MQRELISNALNKRFMEVRGRVSQLAPEHFGEMSDFAYRLRELLVDASPANLKQSLFASTKQVGWMKAETDCLASLRRLSLGEQVIVSACQSPPLMPFMENLNAAKNEPERRIQLLIERYSCPGNFALPSEADAREYLLTRLMVQDRTRIELNSIDTINSDDLLLKLNLIALYAAIASDLRFLDSLNYYYELLPAMWHPKARHDWLLINYLALYSQAIAVWI